MKTLAALLAGVLLVALALAGSSRHRIVKTGRQASAHSEAVRRDWRIGSPTIFDNLTVFPVLSEQAASADDFITLDEGLRAGKVIITELGADGRSRRLRSQRRVDDNAEVNRLAVTNNSGKKLILIAGEMVIGGKQDRIVGHDCIIEASAKPVPIEVFCVEHGRWSGRESFGQSRHASHGGGGGGEMVTVTSSASVMAMPNVREKAQAKKSQSEVWKGVADSAQANNVETVTGDLKSVYQDKQVSHKLNDYERAFKGKLSATEVIGIVAVVNGRIISADVFANHRLFQAYWPKMLKSYALEALGQAGGETQEIARRDAEAFLSRVEGTAETSGEPGAYRLVENQSSKDASFELESRAAGRALIHFNRVSKQ
ncbi:MAG: ARPP-1 family domain-containing protein [Blastocatellia bacterium]